MLHFIQHSLDIPDSFFFNAREKSRRCLADSHKFNTLDNRSLRTTLNISLTAALTFIATEVGRYASYWILGCTFLVVVSRSSNHFSGSNRYQSGLTDGNRDQTDSNRNLADGSNCTGSA